ncbi:MAG: heavy metal translocating P-type ATPase [Clostridia bacterium]|nr:heavy metal translocating P-type ATPase [Clostridia bacterium]
MTRKQKRMLRRILVSLGLFVLALLLPLEGIWRLAAFLVPYGVIGWDILKKAGLNIGHGQVFDENFLMALASLGAFCTGEFPEGVAVMLFYQVGELFQSYAVGKSRRSIAALMDIRPDWATVEQEGNPVQVAPESVEVGTQILIQPGERIPLDGVVVSGSSALDTSALTGESLPRDVAAGDEVISGCINVSGVLRVKVSRRFSESTVSKILDLVENASSKKAKTENFITGFAKVYTPCVVIGAVLLAVIPSLFTGAWQTWIYRALTFLVISCPCALVISVPMSFFGGIGAASANGILIKGGNYLEALAKLDAVVFDKTGTLTRGQFSVTEVHPTGCSEEALLTLAALAETHSGHPIALSLREAWGKDAASHRLEEVQEVSGKGVKALVDGRHVAVGNGKLMAEEGVPCQEPEADGTVVHVAAEHAYAGYLVIADTLKPSAKAAVRRLKHLGIRETVMLTGDRAQTAQAVAEELGLDRFYAQLLPGDKVARLEQLLTMPDRKGTLAFVGDGINDAPALSRADLGIAMGAMGSDAAIEAADVVLMEDNPARIADGVLLAKATMKIVRQNILFSLAVKGAVLVLGACGFANMWGAVFADVGVAVIAILNAMRALKWKNKD